MIHRVAGDKPSPVADVPLPAEPLELEACYRYCEAVTRSKHHNFPVASMFVPTALRRHIFAVYAFARQADDFADEPRYDGQRARELDLWEGKLEALYHDEAPDHPIFVALADTVRHFDLPITPFQQLLSGFRTDLDQKRYATVVDLENYACLAAAPVAHLLLYLGGYRDPSLHRYAEHLAVGLAFASFWQDLCADMQRGRIYVPHEDLRHFQLREDDLLARRSTPALTQLIHYECARTRAIFERGRPLVDAIGDDMAIEMALAWLGGMRILDKIEALGGRVVAEKPRLTAADKARVVTRGLAWRGSALAARGDSFKAWLRR